MLLRQLLENLMDNARKFSARGQQVQIEFGRLAQPDGSQAPVELLDQAVEQAETGGVGAHCTILYVRSTGAVPNRGPEGVGKAAPSTVRFAALCRTDRFLRSLR